MKPNQYYFLEEDGRSIKVQNGVVTASSTPTPLLDTPGEWMQTTISYERNLDKHGITRSFTNKMDGHKNTAKILRDAFYKTNIERRIYLLIQRLTLELDSNFFRWFYKYLYKGEVDMSTLVDEDYVIAFNIMEGKLLRMLNANQDTKYEIVIEDDPDMKTVKMDGIIIKQKTNMALVSEVEIDNVIYGGAFWPGFTKVSIDGNDRYIYFTDQSLQDITSGVLADMLQDPNWFAKANEDNGSSIDVHVTGKIVVNCTQQDAANGLKIRFLRSNQDGGNEDDYVVFFVSPLVNSETQSVDVDITIPLAPGERLYIEGFLGTTGVTTAFKFTEESKLSFEFPTRYKTTYCKGLTAWTLYKRLIEKITGNADYAQSTLLQVYENIVITCGDAIRDLSGASIKTSLNEFYKSLDAVLCAGSGVENNKIVFEERDHFYDDSNPISIGNVKGCKRSYAKELMANTFKIGYPDSKIDDVNGKYEFNNSHLYTSPVTRVVKEYQIQSAYKTSPYLIETTRINLDGKTTTDNDSDNEVFMLNTEPEQAGTADATVSFVADGSFMICSAALNFVAGQTLTFTGTANTGHTWKVIGVVNLILFQFVYLESVPAGAAIIDETDVPITITWQSGIIQKLLRVTYDSIEGIPEESIDSIFNIELFTPKRMLLRHGKWIRSMLHGFDTDKLTFQTTEKNPALKTTLGSEVIDEDADVMIGDLDEPLFIPIAEECEGEVPIDLVELFEASPNRCFEYTDGNGLTRKGFNIKSALMPNTLQPQGFRLLWVKDNEGAELVI